MATGSTLRVRISADLNDIKQGLALLRGELSSVKKQAEKSLPSTNGWAKGLAAVRSQLMGMVAAYASLNTVRAYVRLADDAANLAGRLRLATKSQDEFTRAQEATYAIAQQTSAEWGSIVGLYAQLAQTTGMEQERILALTKTISQAFTVSGASAQETANGLRQLQQAMAGGVLRAEEFNTIIETSPRIVQALADHFGVSFGKVRKLVNDGKVTSEAFAKALLASSGAIESDFGKLPLTVGRATQKVRNALLKLVGDTETATGGTHDLAEAIAQLARELESEQTKRGLASAVTGLIKLTKFAAATAVAFTNVTTWIREAISAAEAWAKNTTWNSGAAKKMGLEGNRGLLGVGDWLRERFPWLYASVGGSGPDFSNVTGTKLPDFSNVTGTPPAPKGGSAEDPPEKRKKQRDELAEAIAAYNARLSEAIALQGQETELARLNYEIKSGSLKGISEDMAKVLREQAAWRDFQLDMAALEDVWAEARQDATDRMIDGWNKVKTSVSEFALQAARNIQDALGDGMYTVLTGKFEDIADSWLSTLQRMAAELASSQLLKMLGEIGKANSGTWWGGLLSAVGKVDAGEHHTGGLIGAGVRRSVNPLLFGAAPRYHTGGLLGLAPDERAIIGKVGEEVLTRNDPRHRLNGGLAAQSVDVKININNESGQPLQETGRSFDGETLLVNFMLGAVANDITNGGRVAAAGAAAYGWQRRGWR